MKPQPSPRRILLFKILMSALPFLLVGLVYYGLFLYKLSQLHGFWTAMSAKVWTPDEPDFEVLSPEQMLQLGWAHTRNKTRTTITRYPKSSYLFFKPEKPKGVYRIGVFGCSYVQGEEAGFGADFPSFLQEKFKGLKTPDSLRVEVINFGVSGYGWHQSYLLFNELAVKYQIDIALLNMHEWHAIRDNTFAFYQNYLPVHARYVLDRDTLRQIKVTGDSRIDAANQYHSFFQRAEYKQYDVRVPKWLSPIRANGNPNYYLKDSAAIADEIPHTYQLIIEGFAARTPKVVVLSNDSTILRLRNRVRAKNVCFVDQNPYFKTFIEDKEITQTLSRSLNTAPLGHLSGLGNRYRANRLYNLLTGDTLPLRYIRLKNIPIPPLGLPNSKPLNAYGRVSFRLADLVVDTLYAKADNDYTWSWSEKLAIAQLDAQALLFVSSEYSDLLFLPLDFQLNENQPLYLSYKQNEKTIKKEIGRVLVENPYVYKVVLDTAKLVGELYLDTSRTARYTRDRQDSFINRLRLTNPNGVSEIKLFVGDRQLAVEPALTNPEGFGQARYETFFLPEKSLLAVRMSEKQFIDPDTLKRSYGSFDLLVEEGNKGFQYPILRWQIDQTYERPRLCDGFAPAEIQFNREELDAALKKRKIQRTGNVFYPTETPDSSGSIHFDY